MSLAEIEAELVKLEAEELRALALKSWAAFTEKERRNPSANQCGEEDPQLLAALDAAVAKADATPGQGHSAAAVRQWLKTWTSK